MNYGESIIFLAHYSMRVMFEAFLLVTKIIYGIIMGIKQKGYFLNKHVELDPSILRHHKIAEEHRLMDDEEFRALSLSIDNIGQIEPVKIYRNLLVDGRHRHKAIKELSIKKVKAEILPQNMTLNEVRELVFGTEIRRHNNRSQIAIEAYLYGQKQDTRQYTQKELGEKFGIDQGEISRAKKTEIKLGIEKLKEFYTKGSLKYNNKVYGTLKSLLNAIKKSEGQVHREDSRNEPNEDVKEIYMIMSKLELSEDLVSVGKVKKMAQVIIDRINKID